MAVSMIVVLVVVLVAVILAFTWSSANKTVTQAAQPNVSITPATDCPQCVLKSGPYESLPVFSGTKRALLIGLDYTGVTYNGQDISLSGCETDVRNISARLQTWGYSASNITILTEDTPTIPTKQTIMSALNALSNSTNAGDIAFVWYSGHGILMPGELNEAWFSLDKQFILDTEINTWIRTFKNHAFVFVGSDSCHSGTIIDIPYRVNDTRVTRNIDPREVVFAVKAPRRSLLPVAPRPVEIDPSVSVDMTLSETNAVSAVFSGCTDLQLSSEFGGTNPQGAMTAAFLIATAAGSSSSLFDVLMKCRDSLDTLNQTPQLSLGRYIDPETPLATFGLSA